MCVGAEFVGRPRRNSGLGRYALAPTSHLTEAHVLNTNASSRRLVAEWGYHWDLSRQTLAEKTPTNMVASRLLQARAQL